MEEASLARGRVGMCWIVVVPDSSDAGLLFNCRPLAIVGADAVTAAALLFGCSALLLGEFVMSLSVRMVAPNVRFRPPELILWRFCFQYALTRCSKCFKRMPAFSLIYIGYNLTAIKIELCQFNNLLSKVQ